MSSAKKCDRCGKYYEPYNEARRLMRPNPTNSFDCYDLCKECNYKLVRWMNKHQQVIEVDE